MRRVRYRLAACALVSAAISACATAGDRQPQPVATSGTVTAPQSVPNTAARKVVPVGHQLDVRLQSRLSSETAAVEDRFEATSVADLQQDSKVLIPAGSVGRGVVTAVDRAGPDRSHRQSDPELRSDHHPRAIASHSRGGRGLSKRGARR